MENTEEFVTKQDETVENIEKEPTKLEQLEKDPYVGQPEKTQDPGQLEKEPDLGQQKKDPDLSQQEKDPDLGQPDLVSNCIQDNDNLSPLSNHSLSEKVPNINTSPYSPGNWEPQVIDQSLNISSCKSPDSVTNTLENSVDSFGRREDLDSFEEIAYIREKVDATFVSDDSEQISTELSHNTSDDSEHSSVGNNGSSNTSSDSSTITSSGDSSTINSSGDSYTITSSGDSSTIKSNGDSSMSNTSSNSSAMNSSSDSSSIHSNFDSSINSSSDSSIINSNSDSSTINSSSDSPTIKFSADSSTNSSSDPSTINSSTDSSTITSTSSSTVSPNNKTSVDPSTIKANSNSFAMNSSDSSTSYSSAESPTAYSCFDSSTTKSSSDSSSSDHSTTDANSSSFLAMNSSGSSTSSDSVATDTGSDDTTPFDNISTSAAFKDEKLDNTGSPTSKFGSANMDPNIACSIPLSSNENVGDTSKFSDNDTYAVSKDADSNDSTAQSIPSSESSTLLASDNGEINSTGSSSQFDSDSSTLVNAGHPNTAGSTSTVQNYNTTDSTALDRPSVNNSSSTISSTGSIPLTNLPSIVITPTADHTDNTSLDKDHTDNTSLEKGHVGNTSLDKDHGDNTSLDNSQMHSMSFKDSSEPGGADSDEDYFEEYHLPNTRENAFVRHLSFRRKVQTTPIHAPDADRIEGLVRAGEFVRHGSIRKKILPEEVAEEDEYEDEFEGSPVGSDKNDSSFSKRIEGDLREIERCLSEDNLDSVCDAAPLPDVTPQAKRLKRNTSTPRTNTSESADGTEPDGESFDEKIEDTTLRKIQDCLDISSYKDLLNLSGRLSDMLSPKEVEEVLVNSERYRQYLDSEVFEALSLSYQGHTQSLPYNVNFNTSANKSLANVSDTAGSVANISDTAESVANISDTAGSVANVGNTAGTVANISDTAVPVDNISDSAGSVANISDTAGSVPNIGDTAESVANIIVSKSNYSPESTKSLPNIDSGFSSPKSPKDSEGKNTEISGENGAENDTNTNIGLENYTENGVGNVENDTKNGVEIRVDRCDQDSVENATEVAGNATLLIQKNPKDGIGPEGTFVEVQGSNTDLRRIPAPKIELNWSSDTKQEDISDYSYEDIESNATDAVPTKKRISVTDDILSAMNSKDISEAHEAIESEVIGLRNENIISVPDDTDLPPPEMFPAPPPPDLIPELTAAEELSEMRHWRNVVIGGAWRRIDMKVITPFRKCVSHGGYMENSQSPIVVLSAALLPDKTKKDYHYVMDNLFMYLLSFLEQLVADDYVLVYFSGGRQNSSGPGFHWMRKAYEMIDRRLRKNLKSLLIVHPSLWSRTIVALSRPFISSKFYRKLSFVQHLTDLAQLVPLEQLDIPDAVKQADFEIMIKEKKKHMPR